MNIENAFAAFAEMTDRLTGIGAREVEITEAERALSIAIRGSYREFLLKFGWGGCHSFEIYGLGEDVPQYLNLVGITRSERTEMEPALPPYLLPVMNDGGGNLYCVDTRSAPGEPPVVLWLHDESIDQVPTIQGSTFVAWFEALLEEP
jgi:hypothetical protein